MKGIIGGFEGKFVIVEIEEQTKDFPKNCTCSVSFFSLDPRFSYSGVPSKKEHPLNAPLSPYSIRNKSLPLVSHAFIFWFSDCS